MNTLDTIILVLAVMMMVCIVHNYIDDNGGYEQFKDLGIVFLLMVSIISVFAVLIYCLLQYTIWVLPQ